MFHQPVSLTRVSGGVERKKSQATVFISYSEADEDEKNALLTHLGGLQGEGLIRAWTDDQITAGTQWDLAVNQAIQQARVAILLVTANFLDSEFIMDQEVPALLKRQEAGELIVIPIIAKACAWRSLPWLARMQVRPLDGKPVWREGGKYVDDYLAAITEETARLIMTEQPRRVSSSAGSPMPVAASFEPVPNPFGDRGRITNPDRFFGRQELLSQIFEGLSQGTNLSLVGESQIGKSSTLSMICHLAPEYLGIPVGNIAYISLEWVDDEDDFYEALCDGLNIELARGFKLTRSMRGGHYLVCLDEIEKMTWDGFTVRVRSHLRGLADGQDAPITLVIASRSPLERLFPDSPEMDSPLAGICRQINVQPFSPHLARAFILDRLQGTGVSFSEEQISDIIAESQGRPGLLQQVAANLYRQIVKTMS
ncbi:MAG TPA: TIR domain-containing protein [Anaerolineae bacterium]|nr:TIR domain-containing protein [Anaerolineae bacterium]